MPKKDERKINNYTIEHSLYIGDKEVCFAVDDKNTDAPYVVCYGHINTMFGGYFYTDPFETSDYIEAMSEYASRMKEQTELARAARDERGAQCPMLTKADCLPNSFDESLEGKIIILSPGSLRREYRTADHQLIRATGGFGCRPGAGGRAVYGVNLWDGQEARYEIGDVLGVARPESIPAWVEERRAAREAAKVPESRHKKRDGMER